MGINEVGSEDRAETLVPQLPTGQRAFEELEHPETGRAIWQ
jgi:hypothetical protein